MVHFSAFRAFKNGLVKPCARHDSNVRPLPPQGSALSPELRAHTVKPGAASRTSCSLGCFSPVRLRVGVYWYQPSLRRPPPSVRRLAEGDEPLRRVSVEPQR